MVVRLAPVVRSYGVTDVSDWTTVTTARSTPSSSAATCASSERLPWPISVDPLSTSTEPSVWMRTWAVEIG